MTDPPCMGGSVALTCRKTAGTAASGSFKRILQPLEYSYICNKKEVRKMDLVIGFKSSKCHSEAYGGPSAWITYTIGYPSSI